VQIRRDFEQAASRWDSNPGRVRIANEVAAAIRCEVVLSPALSMLDYGCGTGLLSLQLLPQVGSLCGADSSPAMLEVMAGKIAAQQLAHARTQFVDFENGAHASGHYDLIVSSMVSHHVPDTAALFAEWFRLLNSGGQVAFADLDTEDGAFHGDNTGVFHLGFDRAHLRRLLQQAGFVGIKDRTATSVNKMVDGQGERRFPIFLIVARKP